MPEPRWWPRFRAWLIASVERGDWPDSEEFWSELARHVAASGPAEDVTDEACRDAARRLMRRGFPYPSDLHKELPDALQEVFRARASASPSGPGDRADAEARSRDCPECAGGGLTSRIVPAPERHAARYPRGVSVSCYCHLCPMGRWMAAAHRSGDPETHRRIIDLKYRPALAACDPHTPYEPEPAL